MFSALPPKADIARRSRHVGFVPTTEVRNGLGISKMVDTIAQAFRACGRRADARD
jgi:hypothetical protein